jgi:hypothetical protein
MGALWLLGVLTALVFYWIDHRDEFDLTAALYLFGPMWIQYLIFLLFEPWLKKE